MNAAASPISISDDSSEDDSSSAHGASETSSVQGTNEYASESAPKPRNIAVKKGMPIPQPQPQQKEKGTKWDSKLLKGTHFLDDFNPENSRREKNKRHNISSNVSKPAKKRGNSMYDEHGRIRMTREDVCDCFDISCPGCHFPCLTCRSQKCGVRCRVNRKWTFDMIELDGKNQPMTNPLLATVRY